MLERLNLFDLLMYLVPGVSLLAVVHLSLQLLPAGLLPSSPSVPGGAVGVLVLAFVAGTAVQALAHKQLTPILKRVSWGGRLPSDVILVARGPHLSSPERRRVLSALVHLKLISEDEVARLSGHPIRLHGGSWEPVNAPAATLDGQARLSADVFDRTRSMLAHAQKDGRIRNTEAYFQYYRGMSLVCAASTVIFAVPLIVNLGLSRAAAPLPLGLSIGSLLGVRLFFGRATATGKAFAKSVYRTAVAHGDSLRIYPREEQEE